MVAPPFTLALVVEAQRRRSGAAVDSPALNESDHVLPPLNVPREDRHTALRDERLRCVVSMPDDALLAHAAAGGSAAGHGKHRRLRADLCRLAALRLHACRSRLYVANRSFPQNRWLSVRPSTRS